LISSGSFDCVHRKNAMDFAQDDGFVEVLRRTGNGMIDEL